MTPARHHAEWLSLVETSGPFLSMPVLLRTFPQGLDNRDAARAGRLREAYEDWVERGGKQVAVHRSWLLHVLREFLEYQDDFLAEGQTLPPGLEASLPEHGETLRPDLALKQRGAEGRVQLLVSIYPPAQDLGKPVSGRTWKSTPGTRMMELLHASDVPLGLVTNGEHWMLVYAPRGETTGFASWYADLWMQEPITLRAFQSLLHLRRFFGVAVEETLSALYAASSKDQQEVTDQLGRQVRQAVEVLVQAFDRIDADSGRTLLTDLEPQRIYDAALTVMMRLVFLFSAEERGLLLLGDPLFDQHYAVSTLSEDLRERADQQGEEVLERRHDGWSRLLATFRAVHGGVEHDAMRLPEYGGSLFDPDRFPFLEGRPRDSSWKSTAAKPLPVNNRVVLHLLEAMQVLRVKVPGGGPAEARRLSFRALDIEQIGHVYEGLLDHTARRATDVMLGLAGKLEPEVSLTKLEELVATDKGRLLAFLKGETGRTEKALSKAIESPKLVDEHALHVACDSDVRIVNRVRPFASLLREDSFGQLIVIPAGSLFVTLGTGRRSTGTHYTPRSLTEPIVQHTLEPLVYVGPAEGKPKAEWKLKSAREILALKVCDMAMGSGAFLVQTCRYLAERLAEAWEQTENSHPNEFITTPEGELSGGAVTDRLLSADPDERLAIARRYVADRCLYGVDINPMAVEMAKLSLWLITLQRDRPFTFLDHALKCGDSLLGVSSVQQIENFSLRPGEQQVTFATANLFRYVDEASVKRRALEDLPSIDHTQIETKTRLHAEAEAATAKVKALADCLIALELQGLDGAAYEEQRAEEAGRVQLLMQRDADALLKPQTPTISQLSAHAREQLRGRLPFHWAVEFPEVFARGGFDAFVGNPPFMGGKKISGGLSANYRSYLVVQIADNKRGNSDLCAYFFLRAHALLLTKNAVFGLVATNTIAQGDTREVGLDQLLHDRNGSLLIRAVRSTRWPGEAALEIAEVWLWRGKWAGAIVLDDQPATGITAFLGQPSATSGNPERLAANSGRSFQGSVVLGLGFVLQPDEAHRLIEKDNKNRDVTFPYLNGDDLNTRPDQSPSRWVINFRDWPLDSAHDNPDNPHGPPYAADYLDCLAIVRERVKPERDKLGLKEDVSAKTYARLWWQHARKGKDLYEKVARLKRVLVKTQVSPTWAFDWVDANQVFDQRLIVLPNNTFSALQNSFHYCWAIEFGSTLGKTTYNYAPTDVYETFPLPADTQQSENIGNDYHEFRRQLMLSRQEGLTTIYNRFHNRGEQSADIARLRALHEEMDQTVAAAYGWSDLDLGLGFHATKQGERYTLCETARRTVLDRLLALNHERYAEEVAAGLHDKKMKRKSKSGTKRRRQAKPTAEPGPTQSTLFPDPQGDLFA